MRKLLLLLLVPLVGACATHAPMSEMAMFNKRTTPEGEYVKGGIAVSSTEEGIDKSSFESKKSGRYEDYEDFGSPNASVNYYRMFKDNAGFSFSVGRGFGFDVTAKVKNDFYSTVTISAPGNSRLILQQRILDRKGGGFAPGVFIGLNSKRYYQGCSDEEISCGGFVNFPESKTVLYSTGVRGRFLLRSTAKPGPVLTGAIEVGHFFEIREQFVGFNLSFGAF